MRKFYVCVLMFAMLLCFVGCKKEATEEKVKDLDFTVVSTGNIPHELKAVLEEKKADIFYQTYADGEYMYLCVGYGEQATGGYSIAVNSLYLTSENICMDTTLIGPAPGEKMVESKSYPYIVICTEYIDMPVLFQ